jgi:predicted  nucleic acid-binding Zn-ribbon protein
MRKYTKIEDNQLLEVRCNQCGRVLQVENGMLKEGCFHGENVFGYFSTKDGTKHSFDLCEACYDCMISKFKIPVEESEANEYL